MSNEIEGEDVSLWVGTTEKTSYPTLESDDTVYDVVIVGGGITGIAAAYLMQQRGLSTCVVEKERIVEWTTGGTTAKLSSQHYLVYDYLINRHGVDAAKAYAMYNQDGIDEIEALSKELGIDCDFSRRDAYVYSRRDDMTTEFKAEVDAAKSLGLPASFETTTDLPYEVGAAVKFTGQAQFHPRKFLLGIAKVYVENGGVIYEQTEATDIETGEPHTVKTKHGDLKARNVLQASGFAFWHDEIFEGAIWTKMSYGVAFKLKNDADYPKSMYITTDKPMRTIRSAPYEDGQLMIFGGESHEYDDDSYDPDKHYINLIDDARQKFDVEEVKYRWLAGDAMPYDRMPYIGEYPEYPGIYIATGYRAWGLAWAMSAVHIITNQILGTPDELAEPFGLDRLKNKPDPDARQKESLMQE